MIQKDSAVFKIAFQVLKLAIFGGLLYILLKRWLDKPLSMSYFWNVFKDGSTTFYFALSLILVVPNWLMEATIWKKIIRKVEVLSLFSSLKAVLLGLVLGILTPFMTGDYIGRVLNLAPSKRKAGVGVNLAGSYIFTLLSLQLGTVGLFYYVFFVGENLSSGYFLGFYLLLFASIAGFLLLIFTVPLFLLNNRILKPFFISLADFKFSELFEIYLLAFFRYVIFLSQFVIMFWAFGIEISTLATIGGVLLIFLAKTIGAGINIFGDLSARELVGVTYFNHFGADEAQVAWVIFLVWLINVIIPAFGGLLVLLGIKNFSFKNVVD